MHAKLKMRLQNLTNILWQLIIRQLLLQQKHKMRTSLQKFNLSSHALFLAVMFCLLRVTFNQCQACVQLRFYSCNICYDNCTQTQSQQFQSCSYTYCAQEYYDITNNSSSCARYQTKQLPENQCFGQCCQSSQDFFSVQQLNKCYNKSQENIKIGIIVGSVIGGIFLLIFCGCCIRMGACGSIFGCIWECLGAICEKIGDCCGCLGECLAYILCCRCCRSNQAVSEPYQPASNNSFQKQKSQPLAWQQEAAPNHKLNDEEENCAICLSNRANTMTQCGHYYHLQCIQEWFKRNQHCPLCKSEHIAEIKFFCRGCCLRYLKFNLRSDTNIQQKITKIKGPNCSVCQ